MSHPYGSFRRITVTVQYVDLPTWLPITSGVVLVDGQRVSYLVGGRIRKVYLAPGEHTVGVLLWGSRVELSPQLFGEGDRLDLVCGRSTSRFNLKRYLERLLRPPSGKLVEETSPYYLVQKVDKKHVPADDLERM